MRKRARSRPRSIATASLILIRETLLALDQANKTGNYTVLRDLGSRRPSRPTRRRKLGEIFASQRHDNLDLSGVAVLEPQLSLLPQIEANGLLHMSGVFPSAPEQVNFDVAFAPVNGQWKLFGISVGLAHTGPSAPPAPPPPAAKSKAGEPKKPGAHSETHKHSAEPQP